MKYKTVLVPFPFDDLTASKVRPAVCLTDEIKPHSHIVLAFITSRVSLAASPTDFVIDKSDADFATTGLKSFFDSSPASLDDRNKINYPTRIRRIICDATNRN